MDAKLHALLAFTVAPPISPRRGLVLGAWFEFRGRGLGLGGVVKLVTVWLDESG